MSPTPFEAPMLDTRPPAHHHHPGYAPYLDAVEASLQASLQAGDSMLDGLAAQPHGLEAALSGLAEGDALHRYAPGKWSVKEVVGHLVEVERVMGYRLLRVSRGDTTPLPGFDEDAWIQRAGHDRRALGDLLAEFRVVRAGTLALLRGVEEEALEETVMASGHPVSGRALVWIMAGHVAHHRRILHERYGVPHPPASPHLST